MAHVPRTAFQGKLLIDASAVKELIFDLAPGAMRQLKREKPGLSGVLSELPSAISQYAATLGLSNELPQQLATRTANIKLLRELLGEAEKLAEVLRESIALHEDEREADLSMIAETVKRTAARKDPSVTAAFESLLTYVSQVAAKAAATRRKNDEGDEAEAAATDAATTDAATTDAAPG